MTASKIPTAKSGGGCYGVRRHLGVPPYFPDLCAYSHALSLYNGPGLEVNVRIPSGSSRQSTVPNQSRLWRSGDKQSNIVHVCPGPERREEASSQLKTTNEAISKSRTNLSHCFSKCGENDKSDETSNTQPLFRYKNLKETGKPAAVTGRLSSQHWCQNRRPSKYLFQRVNADYGKTVSCLTSSSRSGICRKIPDNRSPSLQQLRLSQ
uniref:Uncharacterized protein n=1 Tax=Schistocephalus solidus TaxID=70667 RepID=A0A0X3PXQ7_SCHSO